MLMGSSAPQQWPLQQSWSSSVLDGGLTAAKHHRQFLCSDREGWGPISPKRWDLTPCFLDLWIVFVALWGVVGGAGAVVFLYKKRTPAEVKKNWHFYTKLYV